MVKLIAKPVFDADLPRQIGNVTLSAPDEGQVTSIAAFKGRLDDVARAIEAAVGLSWPAVNRQESSDNRRLLWVGPERALLIGHTAPDVTDIAAVTDQTGSEAVLFVSGEDVEHVLARLVPIDLRLGQMPVGATARTMIGHMTGSVTRVASDMIELRVMRSMAGTLLHDVTQAATLFAAR